MVPRRRGVHGLLRLAALAVGAGVPALPAADDGGVRRLVGLGSYQTAWAILHRYRTAMVRPGRELLAGRVEVDATFLDGEQPGVPGRGASGGTLVVVVVEPHEPRGYGRARMSVIYNDATSHLCK